MTPNIETRINQIWQQIGNEQAQYMWLTPTGQNAPGRFKQMVGEPESIDGYTLSWRVDEMLGPRGISLEAVFTVENDGKRWVSRKGWGPHGTTADWVEMPLVGGIGRP